MRSILLHVYDDIGFESRLQAALDLARTFDGHITCLHATPFEDYLAIDPILASALPETFSTEMLHLRERLQKKVEERLRVEGLPWDWVHRDESIARALIRYSALSDVVVVSRAEDALYRDEPRPVVGPVAISAGCPLLVIPPGLTRLHLERPMAIAWNGSPEVATALRAALPLLELAPAVYLVEVQERRTPYPRDLAARYLSRHGIRPEIIERGDDGSVTQALKSAILEVGAGLMVMGAYGRSRLREAFFGGVTRDFLSDTEVPLLVAH